MKQALVEGQLVPAGPGAPATAVCPRCEGVVALRSRLGTYFWRHVKLPLGGCDPEEEMVDDGGDQESGGTGDGRTRQVGAFVIGLHPDEEGGYLTLRSLSTEEIGEPLRQDSGQALRSNSRHPASEVMPGGQALRPNSGQGSEVVIYPTEVRLLTRALIDAVADLVELVVGKVVVR